MSEDLNRLRQTKTYGWRPYRKTVNNYREQLKDLRKKYPNDHDFGYEVAKLIKEWD